MTLKSNEKSKGNKEDAKNTDGKIIFSKYLLNYIGICKAIVQAENQ